MDRSGSFCAASPPRGSAAPELARGPLAGGFLAVEAESREAGESSSGISRRGLRGEKLLLVGEWEVDFLGKMEGMFL